MQARTMIFGLALGLLGPVAAFAAGPFQEANAERWGATYATVTPVRADAGLCAKACAADEKCKAWTYVKPGVRSKAPYCDLKSAVPMVTASPCCVSGLTVGSYIAGK
ncbi:MAG: PAN domain-containing protein [Alphaproteobacteria bacterium]|nr:PAN domain-containing protein [Alphaproteobacteria bacterium]